MKKVLHLFLFVFAIGFINTAYAQKHKVALGLRATPDGGGFTGKFFVSPHLAIETQLNVGGVFYEQGRSFTAVGLLEYHIPLPAAGWYLFFGGGLHAGVWDRHYDYREGRSDHDDDDAIVGIDGIGGVAYRFRKIPLALTADIKPAINLASDVDFFTHNIFGIAARFYLPVR